MNKNVWVFGGIFGGALLLVNGLGWWWAGSARRAVPEAEPERVEITEERELTDPEVKISRPVLQAVKQVDLSADRILSLRFTFSQPVDWRAFEAALRLTAGGSRVGWRFSGTPSETVAQIRTDAPVMTAYLDISLKVPNTAEGEDVSKLWESDYTSNFEVTPYFRLVSADSRTPAFSDPSILIDFSRMPDWSTVEGNVSVEPEVPFTMKPGIWHLELTGPFVPGKSYKVLIRKAVKTRDGDALEDDIRREVTIDPRPSAFQIASAGRYLAPQGKLTVPILTMNQSVLTCRVARVLSQNIVQLAMRETDGYRHWRRTYWSSRGENERLTDSLTEAEIVRAYRVNAKKGEIGKAAVNLSDFIGKEARGIYLLQIDGYVDGQSEGERYYDDCLVCVTDLGLSVRKSGEDVTVWATSLGTGQPLAGCEVSAFAKNNSRMASGTTDAQGLWTFKLTKDEEGDPVVLIAERKETGDQSYLPLALLSNVEQQEHAWADYLGPKACEAFIMTERDIYRPGEKVFVQALIRNWENRAPEPFPLELEVELPTGRSHRKIAVTPDALGSVVQEIEMPEYLPSGTYSLNLKVPGEDGKVLGHATFHIESFVPPQTRLALKDLPEQIPQATNEVSVSLFAEHLFGKPADGLTTLMRVFYTSTPFKPAGWDLYTFGDAERTSYRVDTELPEGKTDEKGLMAYVAPLKKDILPPAAMTARFQGRVREISGRMVSASEERTYHIYPFYIGMKTPKHSGITLGQPAHVQVALVDPDGKRVEAETRLEVKLEGVSWVSALRKDGDRYKWESERLKNNISVSEVTVSGAQDASVPFTVPSQGDYILTVTDPVSKSSTSWLFWVGSDGQFAGAWDRSKPERIEIVFDKKTYVPGDTAKIQFRAPFSGGTAWVSLQRTRIFENWVIPMTNNTAELSLKVVEAFAPNVEIAVSMIRPAVAESTWSSHRATGLMPLRVAPPARQLDVTVEAGPSPILPAREMPVTVKVRQFDGKVPEKAAVTVMAVDEGICMLTGYKTPVPNNYFFRLRASGIAFYDVYKSLMPVTDDRLWGSASHIGGGGDDEAMLRLNPVAARRFKPVALWKGNVTLDAEGRATVPLKVPEFAGELRVMAVAWSAIATGSGDCHVKVKRPVVVQPDLPRMLAPGDRTAMTVALHNESGADQTVELFFTTDGPVAFDEAKKTVPLAAGASQVVTVPAVAADRIGTGRFTVKATGFGEPFEDTLELAVRPATVWQTRFENVDIQSGGKTVFSLPKDALEGTCRQDFNCFTLGKIDLYGALDYVTTYPYGCLEQTVSSVFPAMMLDARQRGAWLAKNTIGQEAERNLKFAFARIRSMRRYNGYAMWPDLMQRVDADASLYATLFMACAVKKGAPDISEADLRDSLEILTRDGDTLNTPAREAYYCHVCAVAGRPNFSWMSRLQELAEGGNLAIRDKIHLARALALSGRAPDARKLLSDSEKAEDMEGLAFGLITWLELEPASPKVRAIRRQIDKARNPRFGHWGTTQDNALATLALAAYDRHFGADQEQPFKVQAVWADGSSTSGDNVKAWKLKGGPDEPAKETTLKNLGPGVVSVSRRIAYVPQVDTVAAAEHGLKINRKWFDVTGKERTLGSFKRGEQVIVEISLDALGKAYDDIVIQDLLPAGLEIEKVNLAKAETIPWIEEDSAKWVRHAEARDDRLLVFGATEKSKEPALFVYYYAARVVSAGTFTIPAISAERMYNPEVYGRTVASKAVIAE